jgi:hypothetical protein
VRFGDFFALGDTRRGSTALAPEPVAGPGPSAASPG